MSNETNQSSISEVRDQLSLDFADGLYLNTVGSNLGLNRPVLGYGDPVWRAVVKILALDYKQIANKFRDFLTVMFGPRFTETTSLTEDVVVGANQIIVNDTSRMPQQGTVVLDELLTNQETLAYDYIDRVNNIVYLVGTASKNHTANDQDAQQKLVFANTSDLRLMLMDTSQFPTTNFPYTIVVGKGSENEEAVLVAANDTTENKLTLLTSLTNSHKGLKPSAAIKDSLLQDYFDSSTFLVLSSTNQFPESGHVLINASTSFTTVSATTTTITVAPGTFVVNSQIRYQAIFDGNVTAALQGKTVEIVDNTTSVLTLLSPGFGFTDPTPAAGDTFRIFPRVEYTRNDYENNVLVLRRAIGSGVLLSSGFVVESLSTKESVSLATVQVKGVGWDVIQADPSYVVELLLPENLQDEGNLRTASYIHNDFVSPTPTTTLTGLHAAVNQLTVASTSTFPFTGTLIIDPGGIEERFGYFKVSATILRFMNPDALTQNSHLGGTAVELYQPVYAGTDLPVGDYTQEVDTFPGPYVYGGDQVLDAPTGTVALTTLNELLPGPATVSISQISGKTALEVEGATAFDLVTFPYTLLIGDDTSNKEEITITAISLFARTSSLVDSAASIGDLNLKLFPMTGPDPADNLPIANGYRFMIDRGGANEEVVYVTGFDTGLGRFTVEHPLTKAHAIGEVVELMADVLVVDSLIEDHAGKISRSFRSHAVAVPAGAATWPPISSTDILAAELVQPEISSLEVVSATGLDITGGDVILNFGHGDIKEISSLDAGIIVGATVIPIDISDDFPTTFPYVITIGLGTSKEEQAIVTANNTALDELTIEVGTKFAHSIGEKVQWLPGDPLTLEYDSISGNILSFSSPIVLQSTHSPSESVIDSSVKSVPSDDGFNYPLRMPPDLMTRLGYILDIIRAAGIEVRIIDQR
jgi:hypothetical protein